MNTSYRRNGFTLVELLVSIAIIGVLTLVAIPVVTGIIANTRLDADEITAKSYSSAISVWQSQTPENEASSYSFLLSADPSQNPKLGTLDAREYNMAYMGTDQLPGIEFSNANEIRNAAITAIASITRERIRIEGGNYYISSPTSVGYGWKYYYRSGKVSVERIDVPKHSPSDAEKYWVWLDYQPSAANSLSPDIIIKREKVSIDGAPSLKNETFAFRFATKGKAIENCVFAIESFDGACAYTLSGKNETTKVFVEGKYRIAFYYSGQQVAEGYFQISEEHANSGLVTISFDDSSELKFGTPIEDFVINGDVLEKYLGNDKVVIIPSGEGVPEITTIASKAFSPGAAGTPALEYIYIPDTVDMIESYAFTYCLNLTRVVLPSPNLASCAFYNCNSLADVEFYMPRAHKNYDVETPEEYVKYFEDSECSMYNIKRSIEWNSFYYCIVDQLRLTRAYRNVNYKVILGTPDGMGLGGYALAGRPLPSGCTVKSIVFDVSPEEVQSELASTQYGTVIKFNYNSELFSTSAADTITAKEGVENAVGSSLSIPHIFDSYGDSRVWHATNYGDIAKQATCPTCGKNEWAPNPECYNHAICNSCKESAWKNNIYCLHHEKKDFEDISNATYKFKEVRFSEGFTNIYAYAFEDFAFQHIFLPTTLLNIGDKAFYANQCFRLEIPSNVQSIGKNAFSSETLETIVIRCSPNAFGSKPTTLDELSEKAFYGCSEVKNIIIYDWTQEEIADFDISILGLTETEESPIEVVFASSANE